MKTHLALRRTSPVALLRPRMLAAALLVAFAVGSLLTLPTSHAQTITSAVPGFLSYQGRVTTPAGALVGAGTPVNRTVTFRIWNHPTDSLAANLIYSEQQVATISEGEFSVLIGQGSATVGTPLGYAESTKGKPTVTIADLGVFGNAVRYLGVTVDDGNAGTVDPEISPRQQIVSSAFAFRAKYAEQIGSNGATTLTTLDNGNVGIGNANPSAKLDVNGNIRAAGGGATPTPNANPTGGYMFSSGDYDGGIFSPADGTMTFYTDNTEKVRINSVGNVGIGTTNPLTKLDVNGNISASAAGGYVFGGGDTDTGMFSPGDNNILFKTGNVERLRLDSNGRLGLGTAGPSFSLEVRSATPEIAVGTSGGVEGALYLGNNSHGLKRNFASTANDVGLYTTAGKIHLSAAGATAGHFVVTSAGDVGIGTASPSAPLQVSRANTAGTTALQVLPGRLFGATELLNAVTLDIPGTANGTVGVWDNFEVSGNSTTAGRVAVLDANHYLSATAGSGISLSTYQVTDGLLLQQVTGNVGIGTTSPGAKLDVAGRLRVSSDTTNGITIRGTGNNNTPAELTFDKTVAGGTHTAAVGYAPNRGAFLWVNGADRMNVLTDGKVGIGITAPLAPLHVVGSTRTSFVLSAYLHGSGAADLTNDPTRTDLDHSVIAEKRIRAEAFDVVSDARIKNLIGRSDSGTDLATLQKIEIVDYAFKDPTQKAGQTEKKVIAQQVEAVFPQAVGRSKGVVPDIMRPAAIDADGWVALATDLKAGDRVRLITATKQDIHEVLAVEPGRFRTAFATATDQAFVYGREVSDFRSVDYDAIAMLNVSATQQLKRDTDAELKSLREENAALRAQVAALAAKENARDAKLAAIEKLLAAPNTVMARPAAVPATTQQ